jgi:hypothetical protein
MTLLQILKFRFCVALSYLYCIVADSADQNFSDGTDLYVFQILVMTYQSQRQCKVFLPLSLMLLKFVCNVADIAKSR